MLRLLLKHIVAVLVAVVAWSCASAEAGEPYQGLYVVMDPYGPYYLRELQVAAGTPCVANQPSKTSPFCTASNGVLLRIAWCNFQLYHVNNANGQPYPGCHYSLGLSSGNKPVQVTSGDTTSPCPGLYDTCSGTTVSVLSSALSYIGQISAQRAKAGLPPLKLSVGLFAGIGTPQALLDSGGYVDVAHNNTPTLTSSKTQCYRLPLPWKSAFLSSYEKAFDQLMAYIPTQMPQGANIAIVKVAGITATDLEVEMPGQPDPITAPADPGPATKGPLLNCSSTVAGAQTWLNAYNAAPVGRYTFSQANESAFGALIGHAWGTLANDGLQSALLSTPTTNGSAFAYVDCGLTGASPCKVNPVPSSWSTYYLETYVDDLFNGGLAYTSAASAYAAIRKDTFSFAPQQLTVNATNLSPAPLVPTQQIPCILNNTIPANDPIYLLDFVSTPVNGVGTTIGWQTNVNEGSTCSSGKYAQTLNSGIAEGSLFEEVETDAAFDHLATCSPALSAALTSLLAASAPTTCVY